MNGVLEAQIRLRVDGSEANYRTGIINGARLIHIFLELAADLLVQHEGGPGTLVSLQEVHFLAPVFVDDYVNGCVRTILFGHSIRQIEYRAWKTKDGKELTVCRAIGTWVGKKT